MSSQAPNPKHKIIMFNKAERIVTLINKYLAGTINETEQHELHEWVSRSDENLAIFQERVDEDRLVDDYMKGIYRVDHDAAWKRIEQAVRLKKTPLTIRWWRSLSTDLSTDLSTEASAKVGALAKVEASPPTYDYGGHRAKVEASPPPYDYGGRRAKVKTLAKVVAAALLLCCVLMVVYFHLCNRAAATHSPKFCQAQTIHDKPLPRTHSANFKTENPLLIQLPHSEDNLLFSNENVRGVANIIGRQYDVEIEFAAPLAHNVKVSGIMPGNQDMAAVMNVLEFLYDKEMHFEYTGKKIRILPGCKKC